MERAAVAGAAAHGNHISRLGHLLVKHLDPLRHLVGDGPGHEHQVGLTGRGAEDHPESVEIVARGAGGHHLDGAAGKPEQHIPHRRRAGFIKNPVKRRGYHTAAGDSLYISGHSFDYTHLRAPLRQAYTRPKIRIARKMNISTRANRPSFLKATAQGNRNAISRSNRMNRIATR